MCASMQMQILKMIITKVREYEEEDTCHWSILKQILKMIITKVREY